MSEQGARPKEIGADVASKIPEKLQESFARVVKAGMKVMFSEQTHSLFIKQLEAEGDIGENIGQGMAGMMLLLFQKSNQKMPPEIIIPAGMYLMMEGVDFLEKITGEEITPDILATASQVFIEMTLDKLGIPKERMDQTLAKAASGAYK
jgi:hypothetical protein